jgi:hypothetical protein
MTRKAMPLLGVAAAGAALAATLANCGGSDPAGAGPTPASSVAAARTASPRPSRPVSPSGRPQSKSGDAATPSPPPPPSPAPAPSGGGPLADGLYTDAADGSPHYIIALSWSGHDAISGSVTFLYQDGRTITADRYTGKLSPGGKLTMVFGSGKVLTGGYGRGMLTLASCRSVLAWAATVAGCRFSYHGHVP